MPLMCFFQSILFAKLTIRVKMCLFLYLEAAFLCSVVRVVWHRSHVTGWGPIFRSCVRPRYATNLEIDLDLTANLWKLVWIWSSLVQSSKDLLRYDVINNSLLYQGWGRIRKWFWHLGPNPNPNTNSLTPNPKIFFCFYSILSTVNCCL
jgi:hypothetical protein